MAKNSGLIQAAVVFGGGYVVYELARGGSLGPYMAAVAGNLHNVFAGTLGAGINAANAGAGGSSYYQNNVGSGAGSPPPSSGNGNNPNKCAFIPGQQYVGAYGSGYIVVVGGKQIGPVYNSQSDAEKAYNSIVGC